MNFESSISKSKYEDSRTHSHPLLMDPVLQILFSHLQVPDLKNCRLVNRYWSTKVIHALKEKMLINLLETDYRLKKLLRPSEVYARLTPSRKFVGFGLKIDNGWDEVISEFVTIHGTKDLRVNYNLDTSQESFESLGNLLSTHNSRLTSLGVNIIKNFQPLYLSEYPLDEALRIPEISVPEQIKSIKYPLLKCFTVDHKTKNGNEPIPDLSSLWIQVIKNSPNLTHLSINLNDPVFWSNWTNILARFENLESLSIPYIDPDIRLSICRVGKWNLKKLELMFVPGGIDSILNAVGHTLEELRFVTPNESALSPITFPIMRKLRVLSAGNSQLSFPTITLDQLPALQEVHVTYWDWVWSFEELPDTHYYWRTEDRHPTVTTLVIRFPPLSDVTGNYFVMENYSDFCNRIAQKFPSLRTIRLQNVYYSSESSHLPENSKLTDFVRSIGPQLQNVSVEDYCKTAEANASDLMCIIHNETESNNNVEVLDLNPTEWLKVWKGDRNDALDFNLWSIFPLPHLQVAKLLWILNFKLAVFVERAPSLKHLEVIGGHCVNRFDKHEMRKLRPDLKFVQYPCCCPDEDVWYISDPNSAEIFHCLFEGDNFYNRS